MWKLYLFSFLLTYSVTPSQSKTEQELQDYLTNEYQKEAVDLCYNLQEAEWAYATDIANTAKEQALLDLTVKTAARRKEIWTEHFKDLNPDDYQAEELKRQVKKLKNLGNAALEENQLTEFTEITNRMSNIYSTAKICPYDKKDDCVDSEKLSLEPGIEAIMSSSVDYDELLYAWSAWREETGAKIKPSYKQYVDFKNQVAKANGYENAGELWKDGYETDNFEANLDELWEQVRPLYDELHHYVGRKLKERYGDKLDLSDGLIPAHVLGNMWAQSWVNLGSLVKPFPEASEVDVTQAMKDQDYKVIDMFEKSNEFYTSLGLEDNSMSYGSKAMIEKPAWDVLCHASAWDFCKDDDFRIKMCTQVDMEDFITVHHEMGHIQYYLQYKDLPIALRGGANPGFHEAVGDTIALSVATPAHLEKIDLLKDYEDTEEASINALMDMALERVAFLPFGLLIDKWRWDVFSGKVTEDKWNEHWWEYRMNIQKVKPPVERTDKDFDPAAKYHVAGDSQYINYFVAHILEFQMYRGLCIAAGEYDPKKADGKPLHKCDFYTSKAAGDKLKAGLSLGNSKHWSKALEAMTGETELDASALLDYFEPLYTYLKEQREEELKTLLSGEYAKEAEKYFYNQVVASWDFATDVNSEEKKQAELEATLKLAEFQKKYWKEHFQHLEEENFKDELVKRQVHFLKVLGDAALPEEKLSELTETVSTMTNIYSTAKICPYEKQNCALETEGLSLEPGIEAIMSSSDDYDKLLYAWVQWRSMSGAKMKEHYKKYLQLSNEAAVANDFKNKGEMWRDAFETPTFIEDLDALWAQVKPLYDELHMYVANKLKERYGSKLDIEDGLIPAHVLGNMWAQSWINLASLVKPYPDASEVDVTKAMQEKGYTVLRMFDESNIFYTSLKLPDNSMSYGNGSMIEKPNDREVLCHASAWDFYDQKTYRIKMCTEVDYEDFITVHHEMGHIQYFIQYKDQPITLRDGANPGFHEAVGDTIALSVATPTHLKKIGLLDNYEDSEEASINALMDMALERVAFLPFGLLIDKWRWDVFSGQVPEDKWNDQWWHYRKTIQKVKPPVQRTDSDFDPGAKYHVAGDSQYISYFVAHILEFQFYRALCIEAKQYDPAKKDSNPLHKCDFYQSKEAGNKLGAGLSLGSSKHWKEVLEVMTGETKLDAAALMEYFDPLYQYLKDANSGTIRMTPVAMLSIVISLALYFLIS